MRVLQIHCGYRVPAGEDTVVAAEAELLRRRGHDVEQHLVQNPAGAAKAVGALLVSIHNSAAIRRIEAAVAQFQPDVAHVHNTWFAMGSAVVPALDRAGVPVVMTIHNYRTSCISRDFFRDDSVCTRCLGTGPWAGVAHRCYRGSLRLSLMAAAESAYHAKRNTLNEHVSRFIVPSAFMADRLGEMGFDPARLVVKPHFIDDGGARSVPAAECRRVVFVGRLAAGKGVAALLRAWERVGETGLVLTIVGDGPLASELRESAPRGVEFLGWTARDEVMHLMRESRALVFPSEWYEPFGMVLIEAMAAGLPIIVNNIADAVPITAAHPRLIGVPQDDGALAGCLTELADDAFVSAESARMRARYERMYTPESNGPLLEQIYRDASGAWAR
jgi:glycosyltransferase involved in cell wall biosynthesis